MTPFTGTRGNYIRCGSTGGSPAWYRMYGFPFGTSPDYNNYYYNTTNVAEFWHSTNFIAVNQEVECRSSVNMLSGFVGLFLKNTTS